jgi:hypothetical protein
MSNPISNRSAVSQGWLRPEPLPGGSPDEDLPAGSGAGVQLPPESFLPKSEQVAILGEPLALPVDDVSRLIN